MIEKQTVKNYLQLAKEIATYAKEMRLDGKYLGRSTYFVNDCVFFDNLVLVTDALLINCRFSVYCIEIDSENFSDSLNSLYTRCLSEFEAYRLQNDKELAKKIKEKKKEELENLETRIAELKQQLNLD